MFNTNLIAKFQTLETPFYYYDLDLFKKTLKVLKDSIYDDYNIYFAIKSNNNDEIIQIIKNYDLGIDAVSINEIIKALDSGFNCISLSESRLRTETAGLMACNILNIINQ